MPKLSGINHKRAVKAFQKAGFEIIRQGKHISTGLFHSCQPENKFSV